MLTGHLVRSGSGSLHGGQRALPPSGLLSWPMGRSGARARAPRSQARHVRAVGCGGPAAGSD